MGHDPMSANLFRMFFVKLRKIVILPAPACRSQAVTLMIFREVIEF